MKSSQTGNAVARWGHVSEFIAQQLYPNIKREDLTEEQRQTISALGTMAAGLAGGLNGNSSADAVVGARLGRTRSKTTAFYYQGQFQYPFRGCH